VGAKPHTITRMGIARTFQNIRLFGAMSALDNVLVGMHARLKANVVEAVLRTPRERREEREAEAQARDSAKNLLALGINAVLGPVVDVGPEEDPALGARIFSDDPGKVAAYAKGTVSAYNRGHLFSTPGHFPGLGSASQATEQGTANVGLSVGELRRADFIPFRAAIAAHAPAIMLSSALYPIDDYTTPAVLSPKVATDLLRGELHFRGVAVTDDLADPGITTLETVPDAAVKAINAGADMLWISGPPGDQQAAYVAVLRAVRRGEISRVRLNRAVLRILSAKRRYGLIR
jgi:beta-N-acetylhexosaminidase